MSFRTTLLGITAGFALAIGMAGAASAAAVLNGTPGSCGATCQTGIANTLGSGNWTLVGTPEIFGTGAPDGSGNGIFLGGGTVTYTLRSANFPHQFGVADDDDGHDDQVVLFNGPADLGVSKSFTDPDTGGGVFDFVFFFRTLNSGSNNDDGTCFSDGSGCDEGRNMAIYRQDGTTNFAFFYDDAGPAGSGDDDNDFNDMVVLASVQEVPEPMTLGLLGAGLLGLGMAARRRRQS